MLKVVEIFTITTLHLLLRPQNFFSYYRVYPLLRYFSLSYLQWVSQNSLIRSQASIIISFGTVNTILKNPGKWKHGEPGNTPTLCSFKSFCENSKHVLIFVNFSSSILHIKYMEPRGMIGIKPGQDDKILYAATAWFCEN